MAGHADAAEQLDDTAPMNQDDEPDKGESDENATRSDHSSRRQRRGGARPAIAVGLVVVAVLGGLAGWLGYRDYQDREEMNQRNLFVQTARQAALNLTTISYNEVEADVQRVLDCTTGPFHDDFQKRAQPFIEAVKQAQSTSEGTIAEAGLESVTGDEAQVVLAVTIKTSIAAAPESDPRRWRMRISVQKIGDNAKVSNVAFVP